MILQLAESRCHSVSYFEFTVCKSLLLLSSFRGAWNRFISAHHWYSPYMGQVAFIRKNTRDL